MTVKQLIKLLSKQPQDLKVVVDGYESSYDNIYSGSIRLIAIKKPKFYIVYDGEYKDADNDKSDCIKAVVISR
jgi:hypothetical protein